MNLPDTERAYFAGLIDGEGCIGCARWRKTYQLAIQVEMCEPIVVRLLYRYYGGSIYRRIPKQPDKHRISWCWRTTGYGCVKVLDDIEPFLRVKIQQLRLARQFILTLRANNDKSRQLNKREIKIRARIARRFRKLNRRGPQ